MDMSLPRVETSLTAQFKQFGQRKGAELDTSIFNTLESERFSYNQGPLTHTRED